MPSARRSTLWRLVPPLAYMAVVFALSHSPSPPLPRALWALGDKTLHAVEYVPMGFLWARALRAAGARAAGWGWLAAAGFGLTDELHQAFVPRRVPSALDLLADTVGAAVGALAWLALRWLARRRAGPVSPPCTGAALGGIPPVGQKNRRQG